ncbi:hypothetical protein ACVWWR_004786 [Bradyrhizobium sp. LM3.2]
MIAFIEDHRGAHGVEPICKVLPIAPSTYHSHMAKRRDPARLSARARQDAALKIEVRRVFYQTTSACTACARSGGSSSVKGSMLPVVP